MKGSQLNAESIDAQWDQIIKESNKECLCNRRNESLLASHFSNFSQGPQGKWNESLAGFNSKECATSGVCHC